MQTQKHMKQIGIILATLPLFFAGCASNTRYLGKVGNTEFYRVRTTTFAGPNVAALVTKTDETVKVEQVFAGPGLGPTVVSAAGQVGGAAILGHSFPKNVGDNITASGGSNSATGGSSDASANSSSGSSATASGSGSATGGTSGGGHTGNNGNGGNPHYRP
jgi:hypothetical protein